MGIIARSEQSLNAQQIAELTGFSKNHTSKILQQLVKNNFLHSVRGPRGGFTLKKDAKEVSLMEIYRVIDGELDDGHPNCKMQCEGCPFQTCIFGGLTERFSREFKEYLADKTLATL
jgi:Rrf2 family transcriptional regulator, nitric oxide-sensitive transcriptional repressor